MFQQVLQLPGLDWPQPPGDEIVRVQCRALGIDEMAFGKM